MKDIKNDSNNDSSLTQYRALRENGRVMFVVPHEQTENVADAEKKRRDRQNSSSFSFHAVVEFIRRTLRAVLEGA